MSEEKWKEKTFCQLLDDAIADEAEAKEFYGRLKEASNTLALKGTLDPNDPITIAHQLATELIGNSIDNVADTEEGHKKLFEKMKSQLCRE